LIERLALRNTSTFSMAVDFADFNQDGWDDIFVADMLSPRPARRLMQLAATDPYEPAVGRFDDRPHPTAILCNSAAAMEPSRRSHIIAAWRHRTGHGRLSF
jgi:hypothetical protein